MSSISPSCAHSTANWELPGRDRRLPPRPDFTQVFRRDKPAFAGLPRKQHAAFLEQFPDRGYTARVFLVRQDRPRGAQSPVRRIAVHGIHPAAWEDERAEGEAGPRRTHDMYTSRPWGASRSTSDQAGYASAQSTSAALVPQY